MYTWITKDHRQERPHAAPTYATMLVSLCTQPRLPTRIYFYGREVDAQEYGRIVHDVEARQPTPSSSTPG